MKLSKEKNCLLLTLNENKTLNFISTHCKKKLANLQEFAITWTLIKDAVKLTLLWYQSFLLSSFVFILSPFQPVVIILPFYYFILPSTYLTMCLKRDSAAARCNFYNNLTHTHTHPHTHTHTRTHTDKYIYIYIYMHIFFHNHCALRLCHYDLTWKSQIYI